MQGGIESKEVSNLSYYHIIHIISYSHRSKRKGVKTVKCSEREQVDNYIIHAYVCAKPS